MYSRPRRGSTVMKPLSRKLQYLTPCPRDRQAELVATTTGWPQRSLAASTLPIARRFRLSGTAPGPPEEDAGCAPKQNAHAPVEAWYFAPRYWQNGLLARPACGAAASPPVGNSVTTPAAATISTVSA